MTPPASSPLRAPMGRPGAGASRGFRGAELSLAVFVIACVAMMIVPLPTWLMDVLISTNLAASVVILLVVLYARDALTVATFPTLLLLTTLYRLALNVSSARLILLQANAGEVIRAFGSFLVRGNYVVGAVVFVILTVIQFVVIAKGSERVAEVAARFVLDALPGKQMAIDAELRSGAIDGAEARARRLALGRESQFHGAMDGAMKFVKGDAVATVIIALINIVGGLAIGVGQRGMPVVDAMKRYGLLTIGDGLVSEVPALVLATAAGILVTRTASDDADTPLGDAIARELFGSPRALRVGAAFLLLLALAPGLPAVPFVVLAGALAWAGWARDRALARRPEDGPGAPRVRSPRVPMLVAWSVEIGADLAPFLGAVRERCDGVQDALFAELGVPLPAPLVRVSPTLPPRRAAVAVFEVPARTLDLPEDAADLPDRIAEIATGVLRSRASDFLGLAETQALLDRLEEALPATVRNVVPKPVPVALLADVLRRLLEEQVSIRDLRAILEAMAGAAATEKDPLALCEHVRAQLRRAITFRLTGGAGSLGPCLLDPAIEEAVRAAITRTPSGAFLALAPAAARDVIAAIRRALDAGRAGDAGPRVVLTQPDIRRFVHTLIATDLEGVQVVSYAELLPEIALRPVAKATLAGLG